MRAYIIVDLGFGDSGKGLLTDYLVRQLDADIVIRYNGGAQAGHNVVTPDGRHHTFSQFGSGTFNPRVKTFLSRHVVIHPTALLIEGDALKEKGVPNPFSRLRMSDQALVITPFHQAANRIREMARGKDRHGSCGVGVGEAVEDTFFHAENSIRAGDLNNPALLRRKLQALREVKREQIDELCRDHSSNSLTAFEYGIFKSEDVIEAWISAVARIGELGLVVPDLVLERWLHNAKNVVFEGAQGVLLDADAGFHPYTTWSNSTTANAQTLIREMAPDSSVLKFGVVRSYAMRHGPGPLPTETDAFLPFISEHNQYNEWQGTVRYGWFDAVLLRYALSVTGGVDSLAVTHMDAVSHMKTWNYCKGYKGLLCCNEKSIHPTMSGDIVTQFHFPETASLEERAQFTQALSTVTPVFEACEADQEAVIRKIESFAGQPVGLISHGPSAEDVQLLSAFPS